MRGSNLVQSLEDDSPNGMHSLAHELAYALMPESAGSRALADELGLEYDEGAQGIDESVASTHEGELPGPREHASEAGHVGLQGEEESHYSLEEAVALDPAFETPTKPQRRMMLPEQDPMAALAEDLDSTDNFLAHLRRLDAGQVGQLSVEKLASDIIRKIDDTVREREDQVRELLEYEREFRRISGEIGGSEVLGQLDELENLIAEELPKKADPSQHMRNKPRTAM